MEGGEGHRCSGKMAKRRLFKRCGKTAGRNGEWIASLSFEGRGLLRIGGGILLQGARGWRGWVEGKVSLVLRKAR